MADHDDLRKRKLNSVEALEEGTESSDDEMEIELTTHKTKFLCIRGITGNNIQFRIYFRGLFR